MVRSASAVFGWYFDTCHKTHEMINRVQPQSLELRLDVVSGGTHGRLRQASLPELICFIRCASDRHPFGRLDAQPGLHPQSSLPKRRICHGDLRRYLRWGVLFKLHSFLAVMVDICLVCAH